MRGMNHRPTFDAVLALRLSRRAVLGAAAATGLAACARTPTRSDAGSTPLASDFTSVTPQNTDALILADGYRFNIVARWGDSLVTGTTDVDTRRLAADDWLNADAVAAQDRQFGTNADAVAFFPQVAGRAGRGLACVNHEYVNAELIWPGHKGINMKLAEARPWFDAHPHAVAFLQ